MKYENRVRISVLDAGRALLNHLTVFPETRFPDAARQLIFGPGYLASYDFETALPMVMNTEEQIFRLLGNRSAELRHAIFEIAKIDRPFWARAAIYGRQKALNFVNNDQAQCLKDAGLIDKPLVGEPRIWWERLSNEFRLLQDIERRSIGSEAEELTVKYEKERLVKLGIEMDPYLVSLEDETAGYDVYSHTVSNGRVVPYYVEVKGTTLLEPRFFLTRNEWNTCLNLHPQYAFYIWNLSQMALTVLTRDDLINHVPQDRGNGTWMDARLVLKDI